MEEGTYLIYVISFARDQMVARWTCKAKTDASVCPASQNTAGCFYQEHRPYML